MKSALIFAAGVIVGALAAWEAARRWERVAWSWSWTRMWLADTAYLLGRAAGWVVGLAVVLAAAVAIIWIAA